MNGAQSHTSGTFQVSAFVPTQYETTQQTPAVQTGLPVGLVLMRKDFSGAITGTSQTVFVHAFDQAAGCGTYVAMESFTGTLDGRAGTFNFAHTATTEGGTDRSDQLVVIVPGSGTGDLTGLRGTGAIVIDPDGTHHLQLDYTLD